MAFATALIVDDSKLARVTLRKKLKAHGLEVEVADSADQAYEKIHEFQPEIIFMDHLMPKVDGFDATRHIREQMVVNTPIIMCTGKEHDGYLEEALAIGANYILGKPPVDEQLSAVLQMQFDVPEPAASLEQTADAEEEPAGEDAFDFSDLDKTLEDIDSLTRGLDDDTTEESESEQAELEPQATTQAQAPAMDETTVQAMIRSQMAAEKQAIMTELMAAWTSSVDQAPLDETAVEAMVQDQLQQQQSTMQQALEQWLEERLSQSQDHGEEPAAAGHANIVVEMEEVLHPRLIELKSSLMADVERKIASIGEQSLDQDINDFLDLRINVQMAEHMKSIDDRLETLEHGQLAQTAAIDAEGIPVVEDQQDQSQSQRFMMSETITRQLDQLINENAQQGHHIQQLRQLALAALALAGVSLAGLGILFLA